MPYPNFKYLCVFILAYCPKLVKSHAKQQFLIHLLKFHFCHDLNIANIIQIEIKAPL
jgi:hypothetical protein